MGNTPNIRFKGFTDDWEQRKLEDVVEFLDTMRKPLEGAKRTPGPYPYYGASGIVDYVDGYLFDEELVLLSEDGANITDRNYPVCFLASGKYWVNNHAHVLRTKDGNENNFICNSLERKDYKQYNSGMAMPKLNQEVCRSIPISCPSFDEQKKIGDYFRNLDNLITLHQRKCDETKELKKFMLQKMFPKNGEKNPEIRFEGFTDDWEQRKLSDIYSSIGNAFVGTATPYYVEQGHFYLESNNIKDGQINHNTEIFINDDFYEKQKDKWLHTGDMVMVQSGHVGHAAVIPEELDNSAAHALIMFRYPKIEIEPYFLNYYYQTKKCKKKIEEITTGNTIKHILASDMQEFIVDFTNYQEQKQIGAYFRNLDNLITLHQRKCDEIKEIKKFMLQNMFPQKG